MPFTGIVALAIVQTEEPATPPTLKLSQTEISVPASGGPVSLDYSLDNAVEGSVISVEPVSEVDWVTDIDLSVADKISFNVAANEAEESREAEFIRVLSRPFGGSLLYRDSAGVGASTCSF